ncbi:MAG TPA: UbiA family prenyltransferase [Stellaceae bacterium]|nr:UbiA family prenyltransferase [Stellaceae bacterium]
MDDTARMSMLASRAVASLASRPLVVDLDGSLVRTDTLLECVLALLKHPFALIRALFALRHGKAHLKQQLATAAALDAAYLPYNPDVLAYLRAQHATGRMLVLATGADRKTAAAVARHLDLFDAVIASDGRSNRTGSTKLAAIREHLGGADFAYVGNSRADLAVWCEAASGVCVNARPRVAREAARATTMEHSIAAEADLWRPFLRAVRPYRWSKNLLVFVPLVAAQAIGDVAGWAHAIAMFTAFCLTASAIYLINDLSSLAADRQHPDKRLRPFASGVLPLPVGIVATPLLLLAGFALSWAAGALSLLVLYAACSCAYLFWLKSHALADVFLPAALCGLCVLAGSVATGYSVSLWLLVFSSFLFGGLAMVKRVTE